jgi:acetyl esterase/lipase
MDGLCEDLANAGLTAWNLEYRRLPEGGWPETFEDVSAGVDALAGLELDLTAVVTVGHSAGGQLALWAAARPSPAVAVTHAVGQAAVADLAEAARLGLGGGVVHELLGGGPEEVWHHYAAASPAELVPLGIPQLLVHGGRDEIVPVAVARDYVVRARTAGDDVELATDERAGHFEHLDPSSRVWAAVRGWLDRRLA